MGRSRRAKEEWGACLPVPIHQESCRELSDNYASFSSNGLTVYKGSVIILNAFGDYLSRLLGVEQLLYRCLLVLKLLVNSKEVHYFIENVVGQVVNGLVLIEGGIGAGNGDYLIVKGSAVDHSHNSNGANANERKGNDGLIAQNEHVEGVSVVRVCTGNKAVVCGIVGGRIKDTVKLEKSRVLVKLIFTVASLGYF